MILNKLKIEEKKITNNLNNNNNLVVTNQRSVLAKKDFIWLDVEFYDGEFSLSLKLSNYFAQLEERSYLSIEKLNSYIHDVYKTLDFNFLFFSEKLDVREEEGDLCYLEGFKNDEEFDDILNTYKSEFSDVKLNYLELEVFDEKIYQDGKIVSEDTSDFTSKDEDDDDFVQFFIPFALVWYRNGQKKSDFYLGNEFKQHLYFKKNIIFIQNEILIKKFLNKKFIFKIFNKNFLNSKFNIFNSLKVNFFKLLNNSNIFFFKKKKKYYVNKAYRLSKKYRRKKKKKLLMFKKLNLKSKINKNIVLKGFKWFSDIYLLLLISIKTLHSYDKYSHIVFINNIYAFLSQMLSMKLKFFRRYRRRRRLKKEFFRNFEGKLGILNKQINDKEEDKKAKRKHRRKF